MTFAVRCVAVSLLLCVFANGSPLEYNDEDGNYYGDGGYDVHHQRAASNEFCNKKNHSQCSAQYQDDKACIWCGSPNVPDPRCRPHGSSCTANQYPDDGSSSNGLVVIMREDEDGNYYDDGGYDDVDYQRTASNEFCNKKNHSQCTTQYRKNKACVWCGSNSIKTNKCRPNRRSRPSCTAPRSNDDDWNQLHVIMRGESRPIDDDTPFFSEGERYLKELSKSPITDEADVSGETNEGEKEEGLKIEKKEDDDEELTKEVETKEMSEKEEKDEETTMTEEVQTDGGNDGGGGGGGGMLRTGKDDVGMSRDAIAEFIQRQIGEAVEKLKDAMMNKNAVAGENEETTTEVEVVGDDKNVDEETDKQIGVDESKGKSDHSSWTGPHKIERQTTTEVDEKEETTMVVEVDRDDDTETDKQIAVDEKKGNNDHSSRTGPHKIERQNAEKVVTDVDLDLCSQQSTCGACYDANCQWCMADVDADITMVPDINFKVLGKCTPVGQECSAVEFGTLKNVFGFDDTFAGSLSWNVKPVPATDPICNSAEWPEEIWKYPDCDSCSNVEGYGWCHIDWKTSVFWVHLSGSGGFCIREAFGKYCNRDIIPMYPIEVLTPLGTHTKIDLDLYYDDKAAHCSKDTKADRPPVYQSCTEITACGACTESVAGQCVWCSGSIDAEIHYVNDNDQLTSNETSASTNSDNKTKLPKPTLPPAVDDNGELTTSGGMALPLSGAFGAYPPSTNITIDAMPFQGRCVDKLDINDPQAACHGVQFGGLASLMDMTWNDTDQFAESKFSVRGYVKETEENWCRTQQWPTESADYASCKVCADKEGFVWCQAQLHMKDAVKSGGLCLNADTQLVCNNDFILTILNTAISALHVTKPPWFSIGTQTIQDAESCPSVDVVDGGIVNDGNAFARKMPKIVTTTTTPAPTSSPTTEVKQTTEAANEEATTEAKETAKAKTA